MRFVIALTLALQPCLGQAADISGKFVDTKTGVPIGKNIDGLLVNTAQAHVSAASLVGSDGDAMSVVQNVKDFSLLLKGLDKDFQTLGFSITPARSQSPFPKISLQEYATGGLPMRMLGALTLGYAQGKSKESGKDWERRAFSIETSAFLNKDEDPIIAMAQVCGRAALSTPGDEADKPSSALAAAVAAAAAAPAGSASAPPLAATPTSAADTKKAAAAFNDCIAPTLRRLTEKWNRSRYSISYATGWLRPADRSFAQESLGHTVALGLVYGFDGLSSESLRDNAAVTVTLRLSRNEPVLGSLNTASVIQRDSSLGAIRLAGGSPGFRGFVEFSNASKKDLTTTQRSFSQALGIDYAISNATLGDLWIGLRYGKLQKLTGVGRESGSLLTLSYSGKPSLGL